MCRRIDCRKCGKPSWAGCGAHVEQVLGDVPVSERCHCHDQPRKTQKPSVAAREPSWLSRIFSTR